MLNNSGIAPQTLFALNFKHTLLNFVCLRVTASCSSKVVEKRPLLNNKGCIIYMQHKILQFFLHCFYMKLYHVMFEKCSKLE